MMGQFFSDLVVDVFQKNIQKALNYSHPHLN